MFVRRSRRSLAPLIAALSLTLVGSALAAYPSPPFNFAHPGSPHDALYSPTGGNTDRPMLVIYAQFNDVPFPSGIDADDMANRFFGPFPSVAGYMADDSYGRLVLSPAAETDTADGGAANDGVVQVTVADTKANFTSMSAGDQNRALLQLADPFVNFAGFDGNGNGSLSDAEIVVERVDADPDPPGPAGCGATRGVSAATLDGKAMGGLSVAMDGTDSNLITIIHETGHVAYHMRDLYGFGVGSLDLSGPTCGYGDATLFRHSAWQKLHLGWITPTVVDRDGFYSVQRSAPTGASFLLYDFDKGTDDYFLVENRTPIAGTYDRNASDNGLVIWRIDDAQYNSGSESVRPIDLMRPDGTTTPGCTGGCYGGSSQDAWNPADSSTPQRTMTRTWRDGTAAKVAVRAIGTPSSTGVIRAYFDVRGPGVLVDPYNLDVAGPQPVTPDEANAFSIPVMNTGEATDTFDFTFTGLPAGWTASTATLTLGAGAGSSAVISVTPDANAPTGVYTLGVTGTSTTDGSVTSTCSLRVEVVLDRTQIDYTGDTSQPYGEPAGFAALVRDLDDGLSPIVGAPISFSLSGLGGTQTATATTDSSGVATANPILTVLPGSYLLTVSMPRVGKHAPASITVAYTVERRPTTIVYTGFHTAEYSDPAAVSAVLTDTLTGSPLASKLVNFTLGTQSGSGTTDGAGVAADTIVLNQPAGTVNVTASFAGDTIYLPSADTDPFVIDEEDLTFVYTGDSLVPLGTTPILRSQATQEADGFPGDLSLAQARFTLAPTLTSATFTYTTGVSAGGASSTPATGLPVDLWTITIDVPPGNGFWEGSSTTPAELVVFDPGRAVTGGARGTDAGGASAQLEVTARYQGTSPRGQVQLRVLPGRFRGSDVAWIVAVGDDAVMQVTGEVGGAAATLRLFVHDGGEPSTSDTFRALLGGYDSGVVTVEQGNLQVR